MHSAWRTFIFKIAFENCNNIKCAKILKQWQAVLRASLTTHVINCVIIITYIIYVSNNAKKCQIIIHVWHTWHCMYTISLHQYEAVTSINHLTQTELVTTINTYMD